MGKENCGDLQMKNYKTFIESDEVKIDTSLLPGNKALVNGKEHSYEAKFISQNVMVLRIDGQNYFLTCTQDEEDMHEVNIESDVYKVVTKSEFELMVEKLSGGKQDSKVKKEVYSPMPGIIKKLNVQEGQEVKKGDVLLVLEAMKMENEIKAVKDCLIKKINVEPMSSVEKNELLIMLE